MTRLNVRSAIVLGGPLLATGLVAAVLASWFLGPSEDARRVATGRDQVHSAGGVPQPASAPSNRAQVGDGAARVATPDEVSADATTRIVGRFHESSPPSGLGWDSVQLSFLREGAGVGHAEIGVPLDPAGGFALQLPPGRYRVQGHAPGWAFPRATEPASVRVLAVPEEPLRLRWSRENARVLGALVDCLGNPLAGVHVFAAGTDASRSQRTDSVGHFTLHGLREGQPVELHVVESSLPPGVLPPTWQRLQPHEFTDWGHRRPSASSEGEERRTVVLDLAIDLSVRVRDGDGRWLAGVNVSLRQLDREGGSPRGGNWVARTDAQGAFRAEGLGAGFYEARVFPAPSERARPHPVPFELACASGEHELELLFPWPAESGSIAVRVVDVLGDPVANLSFGLWGPDLGQGAWTDSRHYGRASALSDLGGWVRVRGLADGVYELRRNPRPNDPDWLRVDEHPSLRIEIRDGQMRSETVWRTARLPAAALHWVPSREPGQTASTASPQSAAILALAGPFGPREYPLTRGSDGSWSAAELPAGAGILKVQFAATSGDPSATAPNSTREAPLDLAPGPNRFEGNMGSLR